MAAKRVAQRSLRQEPRKSDEGPAADDRGFRVLHVVGWVTEHQRVLRVSNGPLAETEEEGHEGHDGRKLCGTDDHDNIIVSRGGCQWREASGCKVK